MQRVGPRWAEKSWVKTLEAIRESLKSGGVEVHEILRSIETGLSCKDATRWGYDDCDEEQWFDITGVIDPTARGTETGATDPQDPHERGGDYRLG